jgi:ketosteroid isomerase-like protein
LAVPIQDPNQAHPAWADAFNRGDIDALIDLYEDEAVLLADPQTQAVSRGKDEIRQALEGFLSMGASFAFERTESFEGDDVAIVYSTWALTGGSGPDGQPLDVRAQTTDVIRRQGDGSWLFALDNPWGVGAWAS